MVRFTCTLLLLAGFSAMSIAQTTPAATPRPDAMELLQQISKKYTEAKYYHVEEVWETETRGDFSRDWRKSMETAILMPDNRYRFESKAQFGEMLKVSNGKTETNYNLTLKEYTQQPSPENGPQIPKGAMDMQQAEFYGALSLLKIISRNMGDLVSAEYLPDEEFAVAGKMVPCYVIKAKPRYAGGPLDVHRKTTLWIDKEKLLIRKQWRQEEGPLFHGYAQKFIQNETILYPVMELGVTTLADIFFSFQPPAEAKLVLQLSDPTHPVDKLTGTQAQAVSLQNTNGKKVTLQDFHGKPVLLDFWATWCTPCVAALEPLKKLREETAAKGLAVVSIDEDEDPDAAAEFFAKHGVSWPNYHDYGEIRRAFPQEGGIPFYILIDAGGKIVLAKTGAKDEELRAAISKLGIDLPMKDATSTDKPKQPGKDTKK